MAKTAKGQRQKKVWQMLEQWPQHKQPCDYVKRRRAGYKGSKKGCMRGKGGPENGRYNYRGVRQRTWGKWVAEIRAPNRGKRLWLGTFGTAHEAAVQYDRAAKIMYGSSAFLNNPCPLPQNQSCPTTDQVCHHQNCFSSELGDFTNPTIDQMCHQNYQVCHLESCSSEFSAVVTPTIDPGCHQNYFASEFGTSSTGCDLESSCSEIGAFSNHTTNQVYSSSEFDPGCTIHQGSHVQSSSSVSGAFANPIKEKVCYQEGFPPEIGDVFDIGAFLFCDDEDGGMDMIQSDSKNFSLQLEWNDVLTL